MRRPGCRRERGAVAAFVVLALAMLIAFLGAAINLGHVFSTRGEIQNAGDAGALAGARVLDGTANGLATAPGVAQGTGNRNPTDNLASVDVLLPDVTTGHWDVDTRLFTPLSDPAQATRINAVRVRTYRDAAHAGAVSLVFPGGRTANVAAEAIAVGGGPTYVPCAEMPMVVSQCDLPSLQCGNDFRVYWNNDWSDSAGWASFPPNPNVSAAIVKSEIAAAGNGTCTPLSNGDIANIMNGDATSACQTLLGVWSADPTHDWIVPVIDTGGCPTRYVQSAPIVDWIYFRITGVVCTGNPKYVQLHLMCGHAPPPGARPGGTFNQSISPVPPALVQ
jgi:Flp pilus assembly protein TadG